jgi:hypothetical protein
MSPGNSPSLAAGAVVRAAAVFEALALAAIFFLQSAPSIV